ncbi:MAG TPA: NUDIX hydrolase [Bacteroidales bacterium]|nr:NUDIX hydrolase [Bacteroidales bacterium]
MNIKPIDLTVRVYGIFMTPERHLLLTDEFCMGQRMTKFPGGALQLGEGPEDCLKRECKEELGQEVSIEGHLYTTGFYQPTWMLPEPRQLISIYYRIHIPEPFAFRVSAHSYDFGEEVEGAQAFRFMPLDGIEEEELTFPIDRYVLGLLQGRIRG